MKVAIDVSPLENGHKVRGVGFYLKHLKKTLEEHSNEIDFQFFLSSKEIVKADLIHYPYFDPFTLFRPLRFTTPTVVTIHDLTPIKFSKYFPVGAKGHLHWQLNKLLSKKLSAIITDSESSKKDIMQYLSYPKDKIHVVYLAAGEGFRPKKLSDPQIKILREKYSLPEKFALYVGDVTWNKNLPGLIKAAIVQNIPLVLVGKAIAQKNYDHSHPWNADLVQVQHLIGSSPLITALGFVDDEDLVSLYSLAAVFAMPSFYEGFGLPVIEAMQSGCPVVTSKEGSLPEVGGDAVYYVNAYDEKSIADGLAAVYRSEELQQKLSRKGIEQAAKFSWGKTAKETIAVYQRVYKGESL